MKFDILFVDVVCSKPYTHETLENDAIGGTEGSTIRLAEGFATKGHKVAAIQRYDFLPVTSPNGVKYLPERWMDMIKAKNVIHIRARSHFSKFTGSRQFAWLHDACSKEYNNLSDWPQYTEPLGIQCIAVSDWHITNLKAICPTLNVKRIYSPVDETCYNHPRSTSINRNRMVWLSSPHKGLDEALELFSEVKKKIPQMQLLVSNPGYFEREQKYYNGVLYLSKCSRKELREITSNSLCLFYPTQFEETFGLVAAEANALGTPMLGYPVAALAESSVGPFCTKDTVVETVMSWYENGRPEVKGQERFRFENIYEEWKEMFL